MTILLTALDRTEYAEIVLEHALDEAARRPDAELHFLTVVPLEERDTDRVRSHLETLVREGLDAFSTADRPFVLHVRHGRPAFEVSILAAELGVDLLVIGQFHIPSESEIILAAVDCPTLVVGIDGPVLDAQCPLCQAVRARTDGEQLFCQELHAGDRIPDLVTRLPTSTLYGGNTIW